MTRSYLGELEFERRVEAYRETPTDKEAAKRLRIPRVTYASWRKRHGLPPKWEGHVSHEEHERRRMAYEATSNDTEAAQILGTTPGLVKQWRRANGLPTKSRLPPLAASAVEASVAVAEA